MTARVGIANLCGGVTVFVYVTFVATVETLAQGETPNNVAGIMTFVAYAVVGGTAGFLLGFAAFRPVERWLADARAPTDAEREATLRQPWLAAKTTLALWVGAIPVFDLLGVYYDNPFRLRIRIATAILLGGLTTAAVSYLLVERYLRPVFAEALAGADPSPRTRLGVTPRLVMAWALGSGIPFVSIVLAPVGRLETTSADDLLLPMALMAAIGLVAGWLLVAVAARSIQEPLDSVRTGLERVTAGDFGGHGPGRRRRRHRPPAVRRESHGVRPS